MLKPKILVAGSLNMDMIFETKVMPQQGQTVMGSLFRKAAGGKGANQAVQMARLGAAVVMLGKLGRDNMGKELLDIISSEGVDTGRIVFDEMVSTGCAAILLEKNDQGSAENRIIVTPGSNMTLCSNDIAGVKKDIADFKMVVLQNEIPAAVNEEIAMAAKAEGVPVMLNPAPSSHISEKLLKTLQYIAPNEHELYDLTGVRVREGDRLDEESLRKAVVFLHKKGAENVIVTLGSAGAAILYKNEYLYSPAVKGVKVVDPTGAGDSFIGAFCFSVCMGIEPGKAMEFANRTAAMTVTRHGAIPAMPFYNEM